MGFAASCMKIEEKTSWAQHFKSQCAVVLQYPSCFWAKPMLSSFSRFKSPVSHDVFQAQISSISLEKSLEKSSSLSISVKSTDVARKFEFKHQKSGKTEDSTTEMLEGELLDIRGLKTEFERQSYRRSLIPHRRSKEDFSINPSLLGSFLREHPENIKKAQISFKAYKEITETLEGHIKDQRNVFGHLMRDFKSLAMDYCQGVCVNCRDLPEVLRAKYQDFAEEAKAFMEVLQETLCLYYNIEHLAENYSECVFFTRENLINFLFNVFFEDARLYDLILDIEERLSDASEERLRRNIKDLQGLTARELAIPERLLNPRNEVPFKEALETLRKIGEFKSPIRKMKVLLWVSESFNREIADFSMETVTGDDTLLIMLYIVAKAEVPRLLAQLGLMERYAGKRLLMGKSGYYLASTQISARHLCEDNIHQLLENQEIIIGSLKRASETILWGKM